jgi:hypothetical protein
VLALDAWNGSATLVQRFIDDTGVTYPVLRQAGLTTSTYGIRYDNYVLVDSRGIVRYTSVNETFTGVGRFHDAHLRAAIDQNLRTVPVTQTTWSQVKALYAPTPPGVDP